MQLQMKAIALTIVAILVSPTVCSELGECPTSVDISCKLPLSPSLVLEVNANEFAVANCSNIKTETYKNMCKCSTAFPKYCSNTANECKDCVLIGQDCSPNTKSSTCCPIKNGNSYCNTNFGKCEAARFCYGESSCPFDDLRAEEISKVMDIINESGRFYKNPQFPIVRTQEPSKSAWNGGASISRIAYAAVWDTMENLLSEVLLDLDTGSILSVKNLPNKLPRRMTYEAALTTKIVKGDIRWQTSMTKRNLNPENASIVQSTVGSSGLKTNQPGTRITKAETYYLTKTSKYVYWVVVEGILLTIDLNNEIVLEFLDTEITNLTSGYAIEPNFYSKPPLKPLTISQPQGSSIQINGQGVKWYKWNFRYSVDPIHGLQIHHVRYNADCEDRTVIYKMSLGEMYVPYGGKGKNWRFRGPFDDGEIGIGIFANPLKIGLDVPENAILLNCVMANDTGSSPIVIPGCVGLYEKDAGVLYKHSDLNSGVGDVRRGRDLVITLTSTLGNYDYAYDYIFHMDGTIKVQVRLTGIMQPRGVPSKANDPSCIETCIPFTNDYLTAPPHQHFFNYRIDLDVDGVNNYAVEVDVTNDPMGPDNPDSGSFSPKKSIIRREGHHDFNLKHSRTWHIVNANSRNKFSTPRGYALKPLDIAYSYLNDDNPYLPQVEFVKHPVWFTLYKDNEQSPAGDFPRSGIPEKGLPEFIKDKEKLENVDSVLWYTLGVTHSTRPEEWPIMPVAYAGFSLVPFNFISANPELPLKDACP